MVWYIDKNGKKYHEENIDSHIGLANHIMKSNPSLKAEFENSKEEDPSIFFVHEKEWLMGNDTERLVTYNSKTASDIQQDWMQYYILEECFNSNDISKN